MRASTTLLGAALLAAATTAAADRAPRTPDYRSHASQRDDVDRADATSLAETPILPVDLVHFGFDSARLDAVDREQIASAASWILAHPDHRLVLEGRADHAGPDRYNMDLALRRAHAVRDALIADGAPAARITIAGYGERQPLPGDAADNRLVRVYPDRVP